MVKDESLYIKNMVLRTLELLDLVVMRLVTRLEKIIVRQDKLQKKLNTFLSC